MERKDGIVGGSDAPEVVADHQLDGGDLVKPEASDSREEILRALESVEKDSVVIAEGFTSLFASLRDALSQATGTTVDHMNCLSDATGRLQQSVLDASAKGSRFINSCLRLNEEMKGMDVLASRLYPTFCTLGA